jgi:signal transduction histidine kinase
MIANGEGGFLDRDLYPFCFNATDGKVHPFPNPNAKALFGKDERTIIDAAGKNYGKDLYDATQKPEGQISEVSYIFSRPGDSKPAAKLSFVTRVADLGCAVGYYKYRRRLQTHPNAAADRHGERRGMNSRVRSLFASQARRVLP